jgi:hypothetical protein
MDVDQAYLAQDRESDGTSEQDNKLSGPIEGGIFLIYLSDYCHLDSAS